MQVFAERRRRLMAAMGEGAAAIIAAAPERKRSNDVEYRYRQRSDFQYLTGFPEPGAVCVLLPGHPSEEYVLFVRPRDREGETWAGRRAGVEGAVTDYGACAAYPIGELDERVPKYLAERERLYYVFERDDPFTARLVRWLEDAQANRPRTGRGPAALLDGRDVLHEMRLRKEPDEIERLRHAVAITAEAHADAMREAAPGRYEYEIEALIEYIFRRAGAAGPAYPSIVASGANATVLHYTANDRQMQADELLLIDAGAEYQFYCADVTRTFPLGPRFTSRQRDLYEVVLGAQQGAIACVKPGVRLEDVHHHAKRALIRGLLDLGLLHGAAEEIEEKELYKPMFMHRTSHWLGSDVHDVGFYKQADASRPLEPGMVLTVEPGIYLGEHIEEIDPAWRGLGVRIEDDLLVTADGHEVLTAAIPKQVDDLEAIRRAAMRV